MTPPKTRAKKNSLFSRHPILTIAAFIIIISSIWLFLNREDPQKTTQGPADNPQKELSQKAQKAQDELNEGKTETYTNTAHNYSLKIPQSWHSFTEEAEKELESKQLEEGKTIQEGGYAFWSNQPDLEKYTPDTRPMDFHLLRLTLTRTQDYSAEQLASKLLNLPPSQLKQQSFEAGEITGTQFTSQEEDSRNYQSLIIFQEDDLFYLFNLTYINGNQEIADLMEAIAASFKLEE
jgi:hypothetical protein